ncbi:Retrovirus-related Pol polyprotein from transposon TNT 1-94-like protein [Drosera capensis]
MATARSLLKSMHVPPEFWGEAVKHAVYLLNRVPTKALGEDTPYEVWNDRKPHLEHVRVFGCTVYANVTVPHPKKLDDRSQPMVYLGVDEGCKAHRLYNPQLKKLHISRDSVGTDGEFSEFVLYENSNSKPEGPEGAPESTTGVGYSSPTIEEASPSTSTSRIPLQVPESPENGPIRLRDITDIYANTEEVYLDDGEDELMMLESDEPTCYQEAATESAWYQAMQKELESIEKNNTWTLTELPPGHKSIGLKWVLKLKKESEGRVIKHKVRLVAKGYVQRQGIDFVEVFAPVAKLDTVRVMLALATNRSWEVHHMDVKSAFLNGELEEEVYVTQPEGFEVKDQKHMVYRLSKALYGLRQAPRAWNTRLDKILKELGFTRCSQEQAVYTRGKGDAALIVGVYVDDLIVTGGNTEKSRISRNR